MASTERSSGQMSAVVPQRATRLGAVPWGASFDWDRQAWREQAACREIHPDLFFPAGRTGAPAAQIDAAKAVCRICPVQQECLQFALDTNQDDGIWGGKDEEERRLLRRAARERRAVRR